MRQLLISETYVDIIIIYNIVIISLHLV